MLIVSSIVQAKPFIDNGQQYCLVSFARERLLHENGKMKVAPGKLTPLLEGVLD